ncbi:MAG TPA: TolC family protein, partial [Candidatus Binataceae bacterium]|nr:TolC family protein [Candidatus Binataceae bacterium]
MTLRTAVEYALAHHPILRADAAQSDAADENLNLARAGLIPRGYIGLQETRATGNVVAGSMFPMTGIPNVSGPPTDRLFDSGVWGSGAGLSLWWDVAHLTQQMRMVDAALADRSDAEASYAAGRLEVAFAAADAFAIAVEAADQRKAASASADRARIVQRTVDALVRSDLRPGADGARAAAEVALADTQLIHAEQQVDLTRARLAEALGVAGQPIDTLPRRLAEEPPAASEPVRVVRSNPLVVAADQVAKAAAERKRAAVLDYIPRVEIVAALWGHASGLFPGGARLGFA